MPVSGTLQKKLLTAALHNLAPCGLWVHLLPLVIPLAHLTPGRLVLLFLAISWSSSNQPEMLLPWGLCCCSFFFTWNVLSPDICPANSFSHLRSVPKYILSVRPYLTTSFKVTVLLQTLPDSLCFIYLFLYHVSLCNIFFYFLLSWLIFHILVLKHKLHVVRNLCLLSSLTYSQCLELFLVHCGCSISISWMSLWVIKSPHPCFLRKTCH